MDHSLHITYMSFNQDRKCVALGTSHGFRIYSAFIFSLLYSHERGTPAAIVEMLHSSNLVAVVGASEDATFSPKRLVLWNTTTSEVLISLSFKSSVSAVRLNSLRLLVCEGLSKLHLYDTDGVTHLHTLETNSTLSKLCIALTPSDGKDRCHLLYNDSTTKGTLSVYDAFNLNSLGKIAAHSCQLRLVALNHQGNLVATASSKGTIVRVFTVPNGEKVCEFRRGVSQATLYSLSFSLSGKFVTCSSTSGSVHLFRVEEADLARALGAGEHFEEEDEEEEAVVIGKKGEWGGAGTGSSKDSRAEWNQGAGGLYGMVGGFLGSVLPIDLFAGSGEQSIGFGIEKTLASAFGSAKFHLVCNSEDF